MHHWQNSQEHKYKIIYDYCTGAHRTEHFCFSFWRSKIQYPTSEGLTVLIRNHVKSCSKQQISDKDFFFYYNSLFHYFHPCLDYHKVSCMKSIWKATHDGEDSRGVRSWILLPLLPFQSFPLSLLGGQAAKEFFHLPLSLCIPETHNMDSLRLSLKWGVSVQVHEDNDFYAHLFKTSLSFSLARKRESFLISLRAPLNSFLYLCFSRSFSFSSLVLPRFFP